MVKLTKGKSTVTIDNQLGTLTVSVKRGPKLLSVSKFPETMGKRLIKEYLNQGYTQNDFERVPIKQSFKYNQNT